jgi:hypothetical protein
MIPCTLIEYTQLQLPLSGVHSIMMEKSAQPGEGGGAHPPPFHPIYHHEQSCSVYAPSERADSLLTFLLYPYCSARDWE